MMYRVFIAILFVVGISAHIMNSNQGSKWLIYMTDQGIAFLGLHYLLDAFIVLARWSWEKCIIKQRMDSWKCTKNEIELV